MNPLHYVLHLCIEVFRYPQRSVRRENATLTLRKLNSLSEATIDRSIARLSRLTMVKQSRRGRYPHVLPYRINGIRICAGGVENRSDANTRRRGHKEFMQTIVWLCTCIFGFFLFFVSSFILLVLLHRRRRRRRRRPRRRLHSVWLSDCLSSFVRSFVLNNDCNH